MLEKQQNLRSEKGRAWSAQRFLPCIMVAAAVLFLSISQAVAALPSITSQSATAVDRVSATLNALVRANNEDATVLFEYSVHDLNSEEGGAPATTTATPGVVSGSTWTSVTGQLSQLEPGTRYYYRAVAANASGTTTGSIASFATLPVATVVTEAANPVAQTTATLQGTVNAGGAVTEVSFEYGLTTAYGTTVTADASPVSGSADTAAAATISGLIQDRVYHYRLVATNSYGTVHGEDATFSTQAPQAPVAETGEATFSLVANTATLNGSVDANNSAATVTFEYGLTASYGSTVAASQSPVAGTAATPVSVLISGLTANSTYHYRVVATSGQGTSYGADRTFYNTTAPYAATVAASELGNTSATLNGSINPKTFSGGIQTTVRFEYGLTTAYGTTVTAMQSPVYGAYAQNCSVALAGLLPGATYHFRVIAENLNGTGIGEDLTFTTTTVPGAETRAAAPVAAASATLNGIVNPHGSSTVVTFQYGLTTAYGTTVTADQSPTAGNGEVAVSKAIAGLNHDTTYHFRVVASNSQGTVYGADRTLTTGIAPPTVQTGAASAVTATSAVLTGAVNANGFATTVSFDWGLTPSFGRTEAATPGSVSGTVLTNVTLALNNLVPGTVYFYRTVGKSTGGTVYGPTRSFAALASPAVTSLMAAPVNTVSATLNGLVRANNASTLVTFEYGTTTAYGTTVTAAESPVTGTADTPVSAAISGLTPSTTYHFRVVAENAAGTSYGEDLTFQTVVGAPVVSTGPALPLFNGAIVTGTVNAGNAATSVIVEYGTTVAYGLSVAADPASVAGSMDTEVAATLSGLSFNTTYHYRFVATNASGTTNGPDRTFITTLNPTAVTLGASDVYATVATVHGMAVGNGGSWNVRVDYGTTVAYGSTAAATPSPVTGTASTAVSAQLSNLAPGTTYHYRCTVYSGGITYPGADMTLTTLSGPGVTTNAASPVGSTTATLNGTVNANNQDAAVRFEYGLTTAYSKTAAAVPGTVSGSSPTAVSASLTGLAPSTTYHYRVKATNAEGTVTGSDMTFTTGGLSPEATTGAASGVTGVAAVLQGEVKANNSSTTVTFEYGPTTAYGASIAAGESPVDGLAAVPVTAALAGLNPNTVYHYRVVAANAYGTTHGADVAFFASASKAAVTTLAAIAVTSTGATLKGLVDAKGNATKVTFEIGKDETYGRTLAAAPSQVSGSGFAPVSAVIADTLVPDTTYHFRVVGYSAAGTAFGEDRTFYTGKQGFPWLVLLPGLVAPDKAIPRETDKAGRQGGN